MRWPSLAKVELAPRYIYMRAVWRGSIAIARLGARGRARRGPSDNGLALLPSRWRPMILVGGVGVWRGGVVRGRAPGRSTGCEPNAIWTRSPWCHLPLPALAVSARYMPRPGPKGVGR